MTVVHDYVENYVYSLNALAIFVSLDYEYTKVQLAASQY